MTSINWIAQLIQLLDMIFFAACNLFVFDLVTEIGHQARWNRYQKIVADFLWILFCGISFCIVLIWNSAGMFRSYIVLGLAIGIGGYCGIVRRYCHTCCSWLAKWGLRFFGRIFSGIKKLLCFPWQVLHRQIIQRMQRKMQHFLHMHKQHNIEAEQNTDIL